MSSFPDDPNNGLDVEGRCDVSAEAALAAADTLGEEVDNLLPVPGGGVGEVNEPPPDEPLSSISMLGLGEEERYPTGTKTSFLMKLVALGALLPPAPAFLFTFAVKDKGA